MYAKTHPAQPGEDVAAELALIERALALFADEMREKLRQKVIEGWRGWNDAANRDEIWRALLAHASGVPLAAGQEVAVANFAMFLWWTSAPRETQVAAAAAVAKVA